MVVVFQKCGPAVVVEGCWLGLDGFEEVLLSTCQCEHPRLQVLSVRHASACDILVCHAGMPLPLPAQAGCSHDAVSMPCEEAAVCLTCCLHDLCCL